VNWGFGRATPASGRDESEGSTSAQIARGVVVTAFIIEAVVQLVSCTRRHSEPLVRRLVRE